MRPVALITGASAGIGAELARVFAVNGHELVLAARRGDRLEALADEIAASGRPRPTVLTVDLEQRDAVARMAAELAARGLEPAIVVNNAGFGLSGAAAALDRAEQLAMIDLNVRALTELSLTFVDSLARHRGGILNVASIAAFLPGPGMAVYYASKAYVLSFTEALHQELTSRGIRVTALCPGPVPTEFQARSGMRTGGRRSKFCRCRRRASRRSATAASCAASAWLSPAWATRLRSRCCVCSRTPSCWGRRSPHARYQRIEALIPLLNTLRIRARVFEFAKVFDWPSCLIAKSCNSRF